MSISNSIRFPLIPFSFLLLALGMAFKHFLADMPYRALLWNEAIMRPVIDFLPGMNWSDYVSAKGIESLVAPMQYFFGFIMIISILGYFIFKQNRYFKLLLYGCSIYFFILSLMHTIYKSYQIGEFLEYFLRWTSPLLLLLYLKNEFNLLTKIARWACSATFVGHALYAIGYHAIPGQFIYMVILGFGLDETSAEHFLLVAGILDLVAAAFIFFSNNLLERTALIWMIIWGFLTAVARIWIHVGIEDFWSDILLWGPEFLIRTPHFLIPFYLYRIATRK